jgi:hypothetical protein
MYCYQRTQAAGEPCGEIWTVGHYADEGEWIAESDWATAEEVRDRAAELDRGREDGMVMRPRAGHPIPDSLLSFMP